MTSKTTTTKPTTAKAPAKAYTVPKGYELKYPHGGYDLLRRLDSATKGPAWWVTCNAHGQMTEAATAKAGDLLGRKAELATWCKGDHKAPAPAKATTKAPATKATTAKPRAKKATAA